MKYIKPRRDKFDIPKSIWELHDVFKNHGYKLYVVGGAVRDFITGDKPKDFDLCTDAIPDKVIEILTPTYKVDAIGKAFGVVVVYTNDQPEGMEIATFRVDLTKGRNPEIKIGGVTIEQDVNRRDLSINSMFYDLDTKEIIDLVGGKKDLENKIIRMVGNPIERIEEDPLRILRVFRFACRYGSKLDSDTAMAIHLYNDISSVSMERIWDRANGEFFKSFKQAKDFQQYLDLITEFKLWEQILPNLKVTPLIKNQDSMVLVLAQILVGNTDLTKKMTACVIPSDAINQVVFLLDLVNFRAEDVMKFFKQKVRIGIDNKTITTWLIINNIQHHDILKFIYFTPSIIADDVMKKFNLKPSKELGDKINELEIEIFKKL